MRPLAILVNTVSHNTPLFALQPTSLALASASAQFGRYATLTFPPHVMGLTNVDIASTFQTGM